MGLMQNSSGQRFSPEPALPAAIKEKQSLSTFSLKAVFLCPSKQTYYKIPRRDGKQSVGGRVTSETIIINMDFLGSSLVPIIGLK